VVIVVIDLIDLFDSLVLLRKQKMFFQAELNNHNSAFEEMGNIESIYEFGLIHQTIPSWYILDLDLVTHFAKIHPVHFSK
jgi:hypothetical protein